MIKLGLDIGPESAAAFAAVVAKAKTVFWNGPMGVAEWESFAGGTKAVAQALTEVDGLSVVGGGDSAAAVRDLGFADDAFGHISTGGGASLEYLEGKTLPGLAVLDEQDGELSVPRKPLMAGNWKMNLNHVEAVGLVQKLTWTLEDKRHDPAKSEVVVIPPFTDLRTVQTLVEGDRLNLGYGAQDLSPFDNGAYTGDISAAMLVKLGCRYVVVGHSERRRFHGEDDNMVNAKTIKAIERRAHPDRLRRRGTGRPAGAATGAVTLAHVEGALTGLTAEQVGGARDRLRAGLGHRHRARSPPPRTPRRCAAAIRGWIAEQHGRRGRGRSGSCTAARSRPATSPRSWPRPTSTAAWSAAPAWTSSEFAAIARFYDLPRL